MVAGLTYFVYKVEYVCILLFLQHMLIGTCRRIFSDEAGGRYASNRRSLALFSIISIVLLVLTAAVFVKVFLNFGRGLKEALPHYGRVRPRARPEEVEQGKVEVEADRLSLD